MQRAMAQVRPRIWLNLPFDSAANKGVHHFSPFSHRNRLFPDRSQMAPRNNEGRGFIHEWLDGISDILTASMASTNGQDAALNRSLQSLKDLQLPAFTT